MKAATERSIHGRTIAVAAIAVVVAFSAFLIARTDPPTVSTDQPTTDAEYCVLAKALPFTQVVDGVNTNHAYTTEALGVLPANEPAAVNDEVMKVRSQLTAGDLVGAAATARDLDAATPTVCP